MKTQCCNTEQIHIEDSYCLCINKDCNNYLSIADTNLDYTKIRRSVAVSLFLFATLISSNDFSKASLSNKTNFSILVNSENSPITFTDIETELRLQHIICSEVVMAQIKIESGHLSSFLLKRTNNMLGMRYPGKRQTKAIGIYLPENDTIIYGERKELVPYLKNNNYAVYASWQEGLADYKLWQDSNFKVREKYLEFLGNNYAEDTLYVSKITAITRRKPAENSIK